MTTTLADATTIEVSWWWDWVPSGRNTDDAGREAWSAALTAMVDEWAGEKVAAARAAWPANAPGRFPFTTGEVGTAVARDLLDRAGTLPGNSRLVWGAGFIGGELRWLPVLVLVQFQPAPPDSDYLMAVVGTDGLEGDIRAPQVEYVTTDHGAGVRVFALARSADGAIQGRVGAALRLEGLAGTGAPPDGVDVLLSARIDSLDQMAVIGEGVEMLMRQIDAQFAAGPEDDMPLLRFLPAAEPEQP